MYNFFKYKYFLYRLISNVNFINKKNGIRVLMYHSVGCDVEDDLFNLYNISPELFKQHANFWVSKNLKILKLNKDMLKDGISGTLITFDDGYLNNYLVAEPILCKFNIPFTVFISVKNLDKKGFLSLENLKEFSRKDNVTIGSHGLNHLHLTNLNDTELYDELYTSKQILEEITQKEVFSISYPYGSIDMRVRNMAEKVGFTIGFTSWSNINNFDCDPLLLSRSTIWSFDNEKVLRQKIEGKWDWMRVRYKNPSLR